MKILVLCHEYPPIGGGGGKICQDLCEGLTQKNYSFQVLTAHFDQQPRQEERNGVILHRIPSGRKQAFRADFKAMLFYIIRGFFAAIPLILQWKPDLIHAHFAVPAGALAWLLSRIFRVPYVLTVHLGDIPGGSPEKTGRWFRWVKPFTHPIWRNAAMIAAVSQFTRALAQKVYPLPMQVIPNAVKLADLAPEPEAINDPPRIVFAGRFVPQKNLFQLVRSLARVVDLPWECLLIGDGALKEAISAEIQSAGLDDRIRLTGWVETAEVLDHFSHSDIFFMPSLSEGLPLAGLQAMASGLALLLSQQGGNPELVDGENGFCFMVDDTEGYAQALRHWLSDHGSLLAARRASYRRAVDFSLEKIVTTYQAIFDQAIAS